MIKLFKRFKLIDWLLTLVLVGFVVGQVYCDVTLPGYTADIVNEMMTPGATTKSILSIGGIMIAYASGSMIATIAVGFLATHLAAKFSKNLRQSVFLKVQSFSFEETNKFSTPSLITRSTNDVQQVQMAVMMILRFAISAPITAVWAILKIRASSSELTLATALWIVLMVSFLAIIFILVLPKFKLIQKMTDKLNSVARENLTGLRVVKAYNADGYQETKFDKVNQDMTKLNLFTNRIMGLMQPVMMLVMNGLSLTIYWLGASLVNQGNLNLGTLMAFSNLTMQVLMAFMMLVMLFIMLPRAAISARRINEILETDLSVKDPKLSLDFTTKGEIEFKNVSFKYPGAEEYVLKNISFKAEKGQTVAIIGSTGSGKSTLINLVPRFYDVSEGEVIINGINIKDVKQNELRAKIGYVPQKGILFSGTVNSNINYGRKEVDEEITLVAAKIARASNFISRMDGKYNAEISQGGKNVSGGQKQRLSIARAVAIEPEIFIFDDSFSALDYKTDREVRNNLKKYTKDATNIIVAQRIGTILDADKIIVLEHGDMVGIGTHKELLEKNEIYREIAFSQLSREELGL